MTLAFTDRPTFTDQKGGLVFTDEPPSGISEISENGGILSPIKSGAKGLFAGTIDVGDSFETAADYVTKRFGIGMESGKPVKLSPEGKLAQMRQRSDNLTREDPYRARREAAVKALPKIDEIGEPPESIRGKNVVDNPEILKDPDWWTYNIGRMAPSLAASIVPAAKAKKAITIAGKAVNMTPKVIKRVASLGAAITGGVVGGGLEASSTYREQLEQTGDEKEAARAAELMFFFTAGLNALSTGKILDTAGKSFLPKVGKTITAAAFEAVTEGAEEPAEITAKLGAKLITGKELPKDIKDQYIQSLKDAATVAPVAFVTGGGAAVPSQIGGLRAPEIEIVGKPEPELPPIDVNDIRAGIESGQITPEDAMAMKEQFPELSEAIDGALGPQDLFPGQTPEDQAEIEQEIRRQRAARQPAKEPESVFPYAPGQEQQQQIEKDWSDYVAAEEAATQARLKLARRQFGMREPSGAIPGMEVDPGQLNKEIGIAQPQERTALPPGQGFELKGEPYTPEMLPAKSIESPHEGLKFTDKPNVQQELEAEQVNPEGSVDEFNSKYPDHALKYDGEQDRSAINKPPLYNFTAYEGPAKGATFSVESPTVENIKSKLDEMVDLRKQDPRQPSQPPQEGEKVGGFDPLAIIRGDVSIEPTTKEKSIDNAIKSKEQQIDDLETQIKDWSERVYKKHGGKVRVGTNEEQGDTPWEPGEKSYSVDYLNEKRRQSTIANFMEQIKDAKHEISVLKNIDPYEDIDPITESARVLYDALGKRETGTIDTQLARHKRYESFINYLNQSHKKEAAKRFDTPQAEGEYLSYLLGDKQDRRKSERRQPPQPDMGGAPVQIADNRELKPGETLPERRTNAERRQAITAGDTVRHKRAKYQVEEIEDDRALISNARLEKIVPLSELSQWGQPKKPVEVQQPTGEKKSVGMAWVGAAWKPVTAAYQIQRGKNKGKYRVTLPSGRKKLVDEKSVRLIDVERQPETAKIKGTKQIAQRIINAENRFIESVQEQFGKTKKEAENVFKRFKKDKIVKIDPVGGQYNLKDGRFWEQTVIDRAAKKQEFKPARRRKSKGPVTLRGRIRQAGGINFLNFKGELKQMDTAVKFLSKKNGIPIDSLEKTLKTEGWIQNDETLLDLLNNKEVLKRGKIAAVDTEAKTEFQRKQERKFKESAEHEPDAPPPGDYVEMRAEDLPEGAKLTIIEGNSIDGWDEYQIDQTPSGVRLKDGTTIELDPWDTIQVRKQDLPKDVAAAKQAEIETEPSLFEEPQRATRPKAEKPKKAESGQEQKDMFGFNQSDMFGRRSDIDKETKREKQISKIKRTLKNETGSSELANDILTKGAELYQSGAKTFGRFRREMRKAFKDVWDKIKKHIRNLWDIVGNQRGQVDVWHGSPHKFDKFTTEKIGTGEGAQSFGWGLYFTDQKGIAEHYGEKLGIIDYNNYNAVDIAKKVSKEVYGNEENYSQPEVLEEILHTIKNNENEFLSQSTVENILSNKDIFGKKSTVYKATLHEGKDPSEYAWLDWYKPVGKDRIKNIVDFLNKEKSDWFFAPNDPDFTVDGIFGFGKDVGKITGEELYKEISELSNEKQASLFLLRAGIDGIRYPAGTLSGGGKGTNYVVFDENAVTIKKVTGILGNEIGSSEIINDIAYHAASLVNSGVSKLSDFTAKMKNRFGDIWEKLSKYIDQIWDIVGNQRGEITIKKERTSQERIDEFVANLNKKRQGESITETEKVHRNGGRYRRLEALSPKLDSFIYWIVDKNRPFQAIQRKLKTVTDDIDLFLKETQRPKRTASRVEKAWDEDIRPFIEEVGKSEYSLQDVELYAHAKHAREANKALTESNSKRYYDSLVSILSGKDKQAAINDSMDALDPKEWHDTLLGAFEKFKDREGISDLKEKWDEFSSKPSGMTNAEAGDVLNQYKGDRHIERLRRMLSAINDAKLDLLVDAGLISGEEYNSIKNKYQFYVPLYREGYDDKMYGASRGLKPSGRPVKIRGGSTRNVVNIVANSVANYEKAINMAEKARSTRALKRLIESNPDPDLWTIGKVKKAPTYDAFGNIRMYPDLFNVNDNEFRFVVDGKQYLLTVNRDNKNAMTMLKTLKSEPSMTGPYLNALAKFNQYLARINTSLSPEFILSNFVRDLQTAGINIKDTGVKGKRMLTGAIESGRAIYRAERGKRRGDDLEALYDRFKAAGGKIGWADVHSSIENLSKKITREIEIQQGKRPSRKMVNETFALISDMNTAVENGVRLHAFRLATEQGFSDERAAQIASDLTVDFTKKGAAGPLINSLYLFANAGIQGSYRIMRAATKSRSVQKTLVGIFGVGFMTGLANSMMGDDEDGEDYFNKIPDFVGERNAIFIIPGTGGKYAKIPLPWGYNFVWNLGTEFSRMITKKQYSLMDGAIRTANTFIGAFNPIASGTLLQTLSPTISDPFVQVAENKNWFGGDLMPSEDKFSKVPKPDSQRYWKSARTPSVWVANQLNALTGGDKVKKGMIDVSPETLDLMADTLGGSALRFFTDTFEVPTKLIRKEEVQFHEIPFLRRIAGEKTEMSDSSIYYGNIEQIFEAKERLDVYRGTDQYKSILKQTGKERKLIGIAEDTEKELKRMRKAKKRHEAMGNKEMADKIKKRMNKAMVRFNKKFNEK